MELVTIDSKHILLNSRMEELSFSKTNYDSVVTQSGLLAVSKTPSKKSEGKYDFKFSPWSFDDVLALETKENKNRVVFYSGKNPFSSKAKTFLSIAESNDYFDAGFAICSMLTQAALQNVQVPLVGAGGIIVDITKDETRLLFVPEDLYKFSAGGLADTEFTRIQAQWLNLTIYDLPAVCFMRAVIAYKMITGNMPYTATDPLERNADLLDHKFTPINYIINGINKKLAYEINKALKLNADVVKEPGKKKKGKDVEDLTPTPDFPLDLLLNSKNIAVGEKLSDEEFSLSVQKFKKRQASRIKFRRFVRRNKVGIIVGIIGVIAAIIIGLNTYSTEMDRYTVKGQTAKEVIETYCMSINAKDSTLMDDVSYGKQISKQNEGVSSIFVIGKMRQQYGFDSGYEDPEFVLSSITKRKLNEVFRTDLNKGVDHVNITFAGLNDGDRIDAASSGMSAVAGLLGRPHLLAKSYAMDLRYRNGNITKGTFMEYSPGLTSTTLPLRIIKGSATRRSRERKVSSSNSFLTYRSLTTYAAMWTGTSGTLPTLRTARAASLASRGSITTAPSAG